MFTSVATQGRAPSPAEQLIFVPERYIQRYRIKIAGEDSGLRYITPSVNNSEAQLQPAVSSYSYSYIWLYVLVCFIYSTTCGVYVQIFPLGQSRISNTNRHTESLPRPVIGQVLRINPYQWNDDDHVCTKLEVYGCPLQGSYTVSIISV